MIQDIILDSNNDLSFVGGDFKVGDSLYQEAKAILENPPASFKLNTNLGIDLVNEIDEDGGINFTGEFKKQLKLDGKKLKSFNIVSNKLQIDVERI
jgi:hypothetical protein